MARSDRANISSNNYRDETQTELDFLDGATAGTITASKAVIYGSSGEVNGTTLQIAGTSIAASAAEINANCDVLTEAVTGANVIAASETGTHFVLNSGTAFASTLPAPAAGLQFWFHVGATEPSGGDHTIVTNSSANIIVGVITTSADGTAVSCAADSDTISFKDGAAKHGDYCHVWSDGTNWYLTGSVVAAGGATVTQAG